MLKKYILLIICLFATISINAQTVVNSGTTGPLTWVLYSNGTLNISGNGNMPDYSWGTTPWHSSASNIKTVVLTDGVKSIGNSAFVRCTSLTSITIPNSVTSIGNSAFSVSSLTSITIPNSVTSIGNSAFSGCASLTSITIPNSVTSIGNSVFVNCTSLTSITIPNSVTSIGNSAFEYCTSLTSITIPNSVTSIGYSAFSGCTSLTSITIPNSVTSIGDGVFGYCTKLKEFIVSEQNQNYSTIDGVIFNKNKTTIIQYPCGKIGSYTIPTSVTSIGNYTFGGCTSLTSIIIPNSVTNIGNSAFIRCTSLTSITIPNSVTSIGNSAFSVSSLTSITIPNSVTSIGNSAFSGCASLTSITIPNSVTSIGNSVFVNCTSLTSITVGWNIPLTVNSDVFGNLNPFNITLNVPAGTKSAYQANLVWGKFNIVESAAVSYTIFASAGSGGTISPSGFISVSQGGSQSFTFTPNTGYEINQVFVDGVNNTAAVSAGSYIFTNVTANHSISASFKQKSVPNYTITASASSGGIISPSGTVTVSQSNSQTFTFTPNSGYEINQVLIDGINNTSAAASGSYTFTNVTANHSISVSFKQKQYTITTSAGSGGSISPSGTITINHGSNQTFTFTPNTDYEINQVLVDGVNNTYAVLSGNYTFFNVTANHTISVSFKQKSIPNYTISASAGSGGSISPSGTITVNQGSSQSFTFTPYSGYEINQVLIDGVNNTSAATSGSYTFTNVTANHSISVSFKQKSIPNYTISASAGSGGSISPNGSISVSQGGSQTFTFTPYSGYEINQVLVDGVNNTSAVSSRSYTFTNVTANHSISVSFKQKQYTITASAGSGGTISPSGYITVNHGSSQIFTFTPYSGYEINQVLIDGVNNTSAVSSGSYTFTNLTANHSISVSFKQKQYTISASAGSGGTISPSGYITVNHGSSQTFTFTPYSGYEINQVLIDGVNNTSAVSSRNYTFSNVTANHTIAVYFRQSCISGLTVQVWDDVLSVINEPANNGGHTFVAYQWQKNGEDLAGETSGNLYLAQLSDADYQAQYSVRLTDSGGNTWQTCPVQLHRLSGKVSAYPNPAAQTLTIESKDVKAGDIIGIYNLAGKLVRQYPAEKQQTQLDISSLHKGVYIVKIKDKQVRVIKINE